MINNLATGTLQYQLRLESKECPLRFYMSASILCSMIIRFKIRFKNYTFFSVRSIPLPSTGCRKSPWAKIKSEFTISVNGYS